MIKTEICTIIGDSPAHDKDTKEKLRFKQSSDLVEIGSVTLQEEEITNTSGSTMLSL